MDSTLKPVLKRQLLFIGASLGIGLVLTYFFGFLIGYILNMAIFIGVMFYIRRRQINALRSFGFSNERIGGGHTNGSVKLKYVCLSCGAEFKGSRCSKCGSNMKKPLF
jgi:hypothetical protein